MITHSFVSFFRTIYFILYYITVQMCTHYWYRRWLHLYDGFVECFVFEMVFTT